MNYERILQKHEIICRRRWASLHVHTNLIFSLRKKFPFSFLFRSSFPLAFSPPSLWYTKNYYLRQIEQRNKHTARWKLYLSTILLHLRRRLCHSHQFRCFEYVQSAAYFTKSRSRVDRRAIFYHRRSYFFFSQMKLTRQPEQMAIHRRPCKSNKWDVTRENWLQVESTLHVALLSLQKKHEKSSKLLCTTLFMS